MWARSEAFFSIDIVKTGRANEGQGLGVQSPNDTLKRQETGEESGSDAHLSSNLDCVGTSDEKDERFHVLRSFFRASQLLFPLNTASVVPGCAEKIDEAESKSALAT